MTAKTRKHRSRRPMSARLGDHVRANVVGYLALFFALGGTASAAVIITSADQIGTGTVASRAILDGSIKAVDLTAAEPWRRVGAAGQPGWTATSCGSSIICEYKNDAGGPTQFYKDAYGEVHLRLNVCRTTRYNFQALGSGSCVSISAPTSPYKIFTLPTGYRPANNLYFAVDQSVDGFSDQVSELLIGSGGSVILNPCDDCIHHGVHSREFSFRAG